MEIGEQTKPNRKWSMYTSQSMRLIDLKEKEADANCVRTEWAVAGNYDFSKSTQENYLSFPGDRRSFGRYAWARASRDFDYHGNYIRARQEFQDSLVRNVVGSSSRKDHPWIVFTAGAMGAGKSHVISWMSREGLFPLPDIVIIDPDQFKADFPEWPGYCQKNHKQAGRLTRRESGYLVEVAQEVAMSECKNIWADGSLRDGQWYEQVFEDIRLVSASVLAY
ncbi:unnamed protein product [Choristocarpus tenellus]